eukprot:CFRG0854T1
MESPEVSRIARLYKIRSNSDSFMNDLHGSGHGANFNSGKSRERIGVRSLNRTRSTGNLKDPCTRFLAPVFEFDTAGTDEEDRTSEFKKTITENMHDIEEPYFESQSVRATQTNIDNLWYQYQHHRKLYVYSNNFSGQQSGNLCRECGKLMSSFTSFSNGHVIHSNSAPISKRDSRSISLGSFVGLNQNPVSQSAPPFDKVMVSSVPEITDLASSLRSEIDISTQSRYEATMPKSPRMGVHLSPRLRRNQSQSEPFLTTARPLSMDDRGPLSSRELSIPSMTRFVDPSISTGSRSGIHSPQSPRLNPTDPDSVHHPTAFSLRVSHCLNNTIKEEQHERDRLARCRSWPGVQTIAEGDDTPSPHDYEEMDHMLPLSNVWTLLPEPLSANWQPVPEKPLTPKLSKKMFQMQHTRRRPMSPGGLCDSLIEESEDEAPMSSKNNELSPSTQHSDSLSSTAFNQALPMPQFHQKLKSLQKCKIPPIIETSESIT